MPSQEEYTSRRRRRPRKKKPREKASNGQEKASQGEAIRPALLLVFMQIIVQTLEVIKIFINIFGL